MIMESRCTPYFILTPPFVNSLHLPFKADKQRESDEWNRSRNGPISCSPYRNAKGIYREWRFPKRGSLGG